LKRFNGLLIGILCLVAHRAVAQQPDTLSSRRRGDAKVAVADSAAVPLAVGIDSLAPAVVDSATAKRGNFVTRFFTKKYPNPRKAFVMSLILPGAGQAYNRKWWKIPLVYGALGGFTWLEINNLTVYRGLRDSYKATVDDDDTTVPLPQYAGADAATLRRFRDVARRNLELSSVILGFAYLLSATDAYVDAHLSRFDVSDDLSLRLRLQDTGNFPAVGLGLTYQLGGRQLHAWQKYTKH
jgi:Family of unknown function (DUF5683)